MTLVYYLGRFSKLKMHKYKGHISPHKVCMLLATMDLVKDEKLPDNRIYYNEELEGAFSKWFKKVATDRDDNNPHYPYYYLAREKEAFWHHLVKKGQDQAYKHFAKKGQPKGLLSELVDYAYFSEDLLEHLRNPNERELLVAELLKNLSDEQRDRISAESSE